MDARELARQTAALAEHLRLALDAGGLGTFRWERDTGAVHWDARLEELFGLEVGTFGGTFDDWVALLHPDDAPEVLRRLDEAIVAKSRFTVEHRVVWPDGSEHWLHGSGGILVDDAGHVTGSIGCTRDMTRDKEAEQALQRFALDAVDVAEQERVHRERLEFLTRINEALAAARTRREVMTNVVWTVVPRLGDWCAIYVLPTPDAANPDVEVAHVDPTMLERAREIQEQLGYDPAAARGVARVIRTGESLFYGALDEVTIDAPGNSDAQRDVARRLGLQSAIGVPLKKRGQVLGALLLIMSHPGRRYTRDDLTLAEAVAARIAASLDNLRLTDDQRRIAKTLQASLLPGALPDIPGVDVAVRYWAAGSGVEVGGDFYDVFPVSATTWAVVMGDVCGTGPGAAAVTALARHTIASAAWHGDDHETVLVNLNRAMVERDAGPFCTAIYGTLEPGPHGVRYTFASGGHPLPVVASRGGVETQGTPGTLIGAFDQLHTTATTTLELVAGDTVVLYTDGATDVADPDGLTVEEFEALVARAAVAETAELVADRLHEELSSIRPIEQRSDDIALLVLRVATPSQA